MYLYRTTLLLFILFGFQADCFAQQAVTNSDGTYRGKTVAQWVERLGDQDDENVRRQAAYALGQMGPAAKAAIPALVEALGDLKAEVRWYAVDALGRMGKEAKPVVPKIVEALIEEFDAFENKNNALDFARSTARALGRIGPDASEAVPLLVEGLKSELPSYRVAAALALWKIEQHAAAAPALIEELEKGAGNIPYQACVALSAIDSPSAKATQAVIAALGHDDRDARRAAANTLAAWGLPMVPLVAKALTESNAIDLSRAAIALGLIADDVRDGTLYDPSQGEKEFAAAAGPLTQHAIPALIALLSRPEENVRRNAIRSLAKMGPLAVPAMLPVLSSDNVQVRQSAVEGLVEMERYLPRDKQVSPTIKTVKQDLVKPLIAALKKDDAATRKAVVRLFAELEITSADLEAKRLLNQARTDNDATVRFYANKALTQLAD